MSLEEFKKLYIEQDGEIEASDYCTCVYIGDEVAEHKCVYQEIVYKVGMDYFKVVEIQSNSGYWGDGERYDPEFSQVVPKEITITKYV